MAAVLLFALAHYALLLAALLPCWAAGRWALRRLAAQPALPAGLQTPLALTVGLGLAVCLLQALAIAGQLRAPLVAALWAVGGLAAAVPCVRYLRSTPWRSMATAWRQRTLGEQLALAALALMLLTTLPRPLGPPLAWDELMYHLPHARQWADSGSLQVHAWLRYPWFPYNVDLLYAAALLFDNDILPHLLHASAGWLTAWLVYAVGAQQLGRVSGSVAAMLWLVLVKGEFSNAYIDMGVALFVFAALVALAQWRALSARRWLVVAAFLLGVALGAKYQVLGLLPFFAVVLGLRDRRASTWLLAALALALPCAYWYGRNALLTGDPFNPIGGPLFGFTDWDRSDLRVQFDDLARNVGLPAWPLWPALAAPWLPALRRSPLVRGAIGFSAWMLLVWALSSRYPRYLIPAYPVLLLLAVGSCGELLRWRWRMPPLAMLRAAAWLLVAGLAVAALASVAQQAQRIATTPQQRDAVLRAQVRGYGMWQHLRAQPQGRIYQLGLEDSLYYAPQPVWGDVFGPWRYRDVESLPAPQMHRKLVAGGFDALVVDSTRMPGVVQRAGFDEWFERLHTDDNVHLYRLRRFSSP